MSTPLSLPLSLSWLLLPVVAAGVLALLTRWSRALAASGVLLAAGMLGWITAVLSTVESQSVLEENVWFVVTSGDQLILALLYVGLLLLSALAWGMVPLRPLLVPSFLAVVPLVMMLVTRSALFGMLALTVSLLLLLMGLRSDKPSWVSAALRYGLLVILAMPLLLLAVWIAEGAQLALYGLASRLFWLGLILLAASFPTQFWVVMLSAEAPPVAVGYVLGLAQLPIVAFLLDLLMTYEWLYAQEALVQFVGWVGVITAVVAGVSTIVTQVDEKRLLGYLISLDMGIVLMALAVGAEAGQQALLALLAVRFVGALLIGLGLWWPRLRWPFAIRQRGVGLLLRGYGVITLLGLPLTVGFGGKFEVITAVGQQSSLMALGTAVALLSATYGSLRVFFK